MTASASEILKTFVLPPMPEALRVVGEEHATGDPNLARIGAVVARDVGLSAEVLRVINSPAFGLRRTIDSIPAAISMLGLDKVTNLVSGAALRASMSRLGGVSLERFWDSASDVALVSARVAKGYTGLSADTAYTLGLFHDCGIPLLMGLHPDYGEVMQQAVKNGRLVADAEREHFGVSHAAIGFHVARTWNLPELIGQAILNHHRFAVLSEAGVDEEVRTLVAALKIGEHVSETFRGLAFSRAEGDSEWAMVKDEVLKHLGMSEVDLMDLCDTMVEILSSR